MNELGVYDRMNDPIDAAGKLGEWIARSGLFGCEKVEQGVIFALECMAQRKSPLQLMQTYHIIDSKLAKRADAMLADYNRGGGLHRWMRSDNQVATLELTFKATEKQQINYTIEDAVKAGLCGANGSKRPGQTRDGGWQKNPDAMLRARAVSKGLRMVAPEFVQGVYTEEEIRDFDLPAGPGPELKLATATVVNDVAPVVPPAPVEAAQDTAKLPAPVPPSQVAKPVAASTTKAVKPLKAPGAAAKEQVETLSKLLKDKETADAANKWLVVHKWLKEGETFHALTEAQATRILAKPDAFVKVAMMGGAK